MFFKRKAEKMEKATDKIERNLDEREEAIQKRKELKERSAVIRERKGNIGYTEDLLSKEELRDSINDVRGDLWVTRDKIYDRMVINSREISYLSRNASTPGNNKRKAQLETRIKNDLYALTLIEEALQRIDDAMSEREWNQTLRDLSNGYKTINSFDKESSWLTKFRLKFNKVKSDMKNRSASTSQHGVTIIKSIDKVTDENEFTQSAEDILVKAVDYDQLQEIDKDTIFEIARNGEFVNYQPDELRGAAKEAENEVIKEEGQADIHFSDDNEPINTNTHASNVRGFLRNSNRR